jgi:subtilisin family serine protease
MAYKYTIGIEDSYYNDNFSFRLKVENPSPNLYCVIDEISLYQDPYYAKNSNRYVKMSGTSMATPHVSALASLVWMLNPNLSNIEVKNIIL